MLGGADGSVVVLGLKVGHDHPVGNVHVGCGFLEVVVFDKGSLVVLGRKVGQDQPDGSVG